MNGCLLNSILGQIYWDFRTMACQLKSVTETTVSRNILSFYAAVYEHLEDEL
jgi:hypothetical protein